MSMRIYHSRHSVSDMPEKLAWTLCLVFLAVGILLIVLGVLLGVRKAEKLNRWVAVDAEIIALSDGKRDDTYTAVEYEVNGKPYVAVFNSYSSFYKLGKTIPIVYDPDDPAEATEAGAMGYLVTIVLGFMGVVLTAVSAFLLIRSGILPKLRERGARPEKQKDRPAPWEY